MHSKRARLDRFMSVHLGINRRDVKLLLAQGRVEVDGSPAVDVRQFIDEFTQVSLDGRSLQAKKPAYIMMHKPAGVVSATRDEKHIDRKSTRLNSSHVKISYAVFCLKK